jgi:hypothetical protein
VPRAQAPGEEAKPPAEAKTAKRAREEAEASGMVTVGIAFVYEGDHDFQPHAIPVLVPATKSVSDKVGNALSPLQKAVHQLYHEGYYRTNMFAEDIGATGALRKLYDAADQADKEEAWTEMPASVSVLTSGCLQYAVLGEGDGGFVRDGMQRVIMLEIPQE